VIVEALCEPEPDEEPLPDEEDEPDDEPPPPPPPPNTLAEADMEPRVVPRLPLMLPRLPRSCGAMIAENRSAVITPVTRSVRWPSPLPEPPSRRAGRLPSAPDGRGSGTAPLQPQLPPPPNPATGRVDEAGAEQA